MMRVDFHKELNPEQYEAATYFGGPLLILAGAGSGKTRALIYRILYLATEKDVDPASVLAVTFTNKAANEMRERLRRAIGSAEASRAWMYTFHGACLRILRQEIENRIGHFSRNFVIYDRDLQISVVKKAMEAAEVSDKVHPPRRILARIHDCKNRLVTPDELATDAHTFSDEIAAKVYVEYQRMLAANNALDFDDLIGFVVKLLEEHDDVRHYWSRRFRHILIDEYQDTNAAQYKLIGLLADDHRNLAVVGDDDQSIYRFRGADVQNILDFQRDFADAKVIRLERNYRSTKNILKAASSVVANNRDRLGKTLWTENDTGELIDLYQARDERAEGRWVVQRIQQLVAHGDESLSDMAIFYRTNAQSRALEEALRAASLPYRVIGALRFYDRAEIKDLLAYLRATVNRPDSEALERIINKPPRGIGKTTVTRLRQFARARNISMADAVERVTEHPEIGSAARKKVLAFAALMKDLRAAATVENPGSFMRRLAEDTEYSTWIANGGGGTGTSEDSASRLENIAQLLQTASELAADQPEATVADFLDRVSLVSDVDNYNEQAEAVTLMTLHCAKGLEFPVVFMTGMEEGIFPHARAIDEGGAGIEEERRLCYVGLTRAQHRLTLSFARERATTGPRRPSDPSRFLTEIPMELLSQVNPGAARAQGTWVPSRQRRRGWQRDHDELDQSTGYDDFAQVPPDEKGFHPGQRVRHPQFGSGVVLEASGSRSNPKLSIRFDGQGVRKILARHTQLVVLFD